MSTTTPSPSSPAQPGPHLASTAPAPAPADPDQTLIYHTSLFLIFLVVLYTLTRLPRAFALFGTSREWFNGHFLRHVKPRASNRRMLTVYRNSGLFDFANFDVNAHASSSSSDDSHYAHIQSTLSKAQRLNDQGHPMPPRFPPHVAHCPRALRPLLTPLRMRLAPGFSVAQFLILSIYFWVLVYAGFYKSNILTASTRTGWIAVGQIPFVFAFSQKNNVLGSLLGYGYEKLNYLHRFAGRIVLIAANIHSFHWFYKWSLAGTLSSSLRSPSTLWGLVALLSLDVIFLFSTEYWRGKSYRLFLSSHIVGFVLLLPATYLHKPTTLLYILAALALLSIDHLFRLLKTRLATAVLTPLPELDMTRVQIRGVNAGWRAGQHVRLRMLTTTMSGPMGWTKSVEAHPFTIASVGRGRGEDGEGMVLMVKRSGAWTRGVYELAKRGGYLGGERGGGREVRVLVEGPYGGVQHTIFASFSAAVIIVGGSGITFALSVVRDLVMKDLNGESRVKVIEVVWVVQDPACLAPLLPLLTSLIAESIFTPLRISVFYTRAPTGPQPAFFASASAGPFAGSPTNTRELKAPVVAPPIPRRPPPLGLMDESEAVGWGGKGAGGRRVQGLAVPRDVKRSALGGEKEKEKGRGRDQAGVERGNTQKSHRERDAANDVDDAPPSPSHSPSHFPPGLTLAPGRPRLLKFIEHALQRAVTLGSREGYTKSRYARAKDETLGLSGLVVGVCGPVGLGDEVATAVGGVDATRREQVGGVEVVEEVFGW